MPKLTDEEYEAEKVASDAKYMQTPDEWPRWPVLPVVERPSTSMRRMGLMRESKLPTVYVGVNMWDLVTGNLSEQLDAKATEVKTYDTFEALALEWRVD